MSWLGRKEFIKFPLGKGNRLALESSSGELMRGWGRVGERQVSQNEKCKTELKKKE